MTQLTANNVAQELFGLASETELTAQQRRWIKYALIDTDRRIRQFLLKHTTLNGYTEILSAGEPEDKPGLVEHESLQTFKDILYLKNRPVSASGLQVWQNNSAESFASTHLLTSDSYQLEGVVDGFSASGALRRINDSWPMRPGAVKVTYCGGPTEWNDSLFYEALRLAEQETVMVLYKQRKTFGTVAQGSGTEQIFSEEIGEYKVEYAVGRNDRGTADNDLPAGKLPDEAIVFLEPYLSVRAFV